VPRFWAFRITSMNALKSLSAWSWSAANLAQISAACDPSGAAVPAAKLTPKATEIWDRIVPGVPREALLLAPVGARR
jgi:hypothetical protein